MNIELLKSSIPELSDQSEFRLKYVGSIVSPRKLWDFGFYKDKLRDTKWTLNGVSKETGDRFYIELHIARNNELYDILVYEMDEKKDRERIIFDYSYFGKKLHDILGDLIVSQPADDIYKEWYPFTEFYKLEDIFYKNWAKEWCRNSENFTDNVSLFIPISNMQGHDPSGSDVLHRMCYTLNFTICAGMWEDDKVFNSDFSSTAIFEHPLMTRLMVALIRHLDNHPCRQCFFELLLPLSVFFEIFMPEEFRIPLVHHCLSYKDLKPEELHSIAFMYDKFEIHECAVYCVEEILRIDPDDRCAKNNLKAFTENMKEHAN